MTIRKFFDSDSLRLYVYTLTDSATAYLTFTEEDIIRNSIKFSGTLIKDLKTSSSTVTLSIKQNSKSNTLTAYTGELKVELCANNITVFKGYLSNKMSLNVNSYGVPAISITLEDVGTKLFKRELYSNSLVDHYFTGTLQDFVALINTQLSTLNYSLTEIMDDTRTISAIIKSGSTIEELLQEVCFELGYTYYWNAGVLTFYKIPTSAESSKVVTALATNGSTAINVNRSIRKYKTARIQSNFYENAKNVLIYRDNSGGADSSKCDVEVKAGSHYPELSSQGEPAQYEAEDIEYGKEIISVSNLQPNVKYSKGNITTTIKQNGAKTITVDIENTSSVSSKLTTLECRADVVRVASTEVVKTSIATLSEESDNTYEAECSWVHTKEDCEYLAKVVASYYNFCDTTYKFYLLDAETSYSSSPFSYDNNLVGKVITLKEDTISGLNVNVLVTSVTINTDLNYIEYSAVGYSKFNMTANTTSSSTGKQYISYTGSSGAEGNSTKVYLQRGIQTEAWWTTNCSLNVTTTFADTSSLRKDCRVGDYFVVTGTSSEGNSHIAVFESTTGEGDLTGTCVSSISVSKGEDGKKGDTAVTTSEYCLSTNASLTEEEQSALTGWVADTDFIWSYGMYIYKRIRTTVVGTGTSIFEYKGRDTDLEDFYKHRLSFNIKLDRYSYELDKRALGTATTTIKATILDEYYDCDSFAWSLNGESITPTKESSGVYSFTIPVNTNLTSYTLNVLPSKGGNDLYDIERSIILTANDRTEECKFFGAVTSLSNVAGGNILLAGDGCFLIQDDGDNAKNLVYIYDGSRWVEFNNSTVEEDKKTLILSKAQQVALEYANLEGNTLSASYAYLGTLIANYISAKKIGAEAIILTGENGKLLGGDYTTKDGEFLANKGVYLDSEGTALLNDAKLKNCTISSGTIQDITITGIVNNEVLTTTLKDVVAEPVSSNVTFNGKAYLGSEALNYLRNAQYFRVEDALYHYDGEVNNTKFTGLVKSTGNFIESVSTSATDIEPSYAPYDMVAATDSVLFAIYNSGIYRSDNGGASWSQVTFSNTARTVPKLSRNNGHIGIGKCNGYTTVSFPYDYSTQSCDWCSYSFDANGNQVDEDRGNPINYGTSSDGVYLGTSATVDHTATFVDGNSYVRYTEAKSASNKYYVKFVIQTPTPSTWTYPYRAYGSYVSGAEKEMVIASDSFKTLPQSVGWVSDKIIFSIAGNYSNGNYMTTPTYAVAGAKNYGVNWTTVTNTWSNNSGNNQFAQFYTIDDSGYCFAVVGPELGSGTRCLYVTSDGINWTFCTSTTTSNERVKPFVWKGRYFFCDKQSVDGKYWFDWSNSIRPEARATATNSYVYSGANLTKPYRFAMTPEYMQSGINFVDADTCKVLVHESAVSKGLTTSKFVLSSGSSDFFFLPNIIPSSMTAYTKISNVFNITASYYSLSNVILNSYTRWNTSTNSELKMPSYEGVPASVDISPSVLRINGTDYINNTWWVKTGTTIASTVTPNSAIKGLTTEDINPKSADACIGNITPYNSIRGNYIYGSSGNDLADCINVIEDMKVEYGYCYCFDGINYYKSTEYMDKRIIGINTDTAGFYLGNNFDKKQLKIAVAGFVLAYVDKEYEVGTPLTCTENGFLTEIKQEDKVNYPERVVAVYWKNEPNEMWGRVTVNGRKWVRIR